MDKVGFGDFIKEQRMARGLSQRGLAIKSGVRNSTIARIEKEQVFPEVTTVTKLAGALGLDSGILLEKCGYIEIKANLVESLGGEARMTTENASTLSDADKAHIQSLLDSKQIGQGTDMSQEEIEKVEGTIRLGLQVLSSAEQPGTKKKEAPLSSDMDDKEALRIALVKAGIIPKDRDITPEEARILFGAAKGVFESFDK